MEKNKKSKSDWTVNDWADFWRYDIGLNVIPADSRKKGHTSSGLIGKTKPLMRNSMSNGKLKMLLVMELQYFLEKFGIELIGRICI
ncbi:MAG: hypothetical protein L0H53_12230 [Candidatus Nitrosocosmicus sp.]|nr:hypothetical protein [Candidatus Nitrosocosmicus sp.]MDN5868239.1 hypothetical protein [Candidatus Nitrosocosmicus sp.]